MWRVEYFLFEYTLEPNFFVSYKLWTLLVLVNSGQWSTVPFSLNKSNWPWNICWQAPSTEVAVSELSHASAEVSEIVFFLLGAMTIVEIVDAHQGFKLVTDNITTRKPRTLLWVVNGLHNLFFCQWDYIPLGYKLILLSTWYFGFLFCTPKNPSIWWLMKLHFLLIFWYKKSFNHPIPE